MFGGGTTNDYDDIVAKATDENLTGENWELILNMCDKVQDEGQPGAHSAIAAILRRLAHRNPNVQLYALSLAEALSKNLGIDVHREIASRAFTQGLEKLITDRNTHDKVRKRALGLIAMWVEDFEKDSSLGVMEDCYNNLKAKNYKFDQPADPAPPAVDDELRRKEEEELQRVLAMSVEDKGGRGQWAQYSLAGSSGGAGSTSSASKPNPAATSTPFGAPKYQSGYVPARTPSPKQQKPPPATQAPVHQYSSHYSTSTASTSAPTQHSTASSTTVATPAVAAVVAAPPVAVPSVATTATTTTTTMTTATPELNINIVTRVRALHTFEPTEQGELAFEKGDIIKVVDRGYKDWWRGQLKGRTGIFPVNYVEPMPEPTASELAKEAEQEAAVFSQAANVERLLSMLRSMDPAKDNLADNEEVQELYRSCMALRPKIVKLIDKYSQKRADLVTMNETFVRARTIFDRMMEESLARHTGVYDQPTFRPGPGPGYPQGRPQSVLGGPGRRPEFGPPGPVTPGPFGWNAPPFEQSPYGIPPAATPAPGPPLSTPYGPGPVPQQPQQQPSLPPYGVSPYAPLPVQQPQQPQQPPPQPVQGQQQQNPYGAPGPVSSPYPQQPQQPYGIQGPTPYPPVQQAQPAQGQQTFVPQQAPIQQGAPQQTPALTQQQSYQTVPQQQPYQPAPQQQPQQSQSQPQPQQQPQQAPYQSIPQPQQQQQHQQTPYQPILQQQAQPQQQPQPQQSLPPQTSLQSPPPGQTPGQPLQMQSFTAPQQQQSQQPQSLDPQPLQPIQLHQPQPQPLIQAAQLQPQQPSQQATLQHQPSVTQSISQEQPASQPYQPLPLPGEQDQYHSLPLPGEQAQYQPLPLPGEQTQSPLQQTQVLPPAAQAQPGLQYSTTILGAQQPQAQSQVQSPPAAHPEPVQSPFSSLATQQGGQTGIATQPVVEAQQSSQIPQRQATQQQPIQQAIQQQQPAQQHQQHPVQTQQPAAQTQSTAGNPISGAPPYVYDPNATYADPNVQLWADYYKQGGTDLAGAVYFISVPGVKEAKPSSPEPRLGARGSGSPSADIGRHQSYQAGGAPATSIGQATSSLYQQPVRATSDTNVSSPAAGASRPFQFQGVQLTDGPSPSSKPAEATPNPYISGGSGPSSPNPYVAASSPSTPSWVLPKKTAGPQGHLSRP